MVACWFKIKMFSFILYSFIVTGHASEDQLSEIVRRSIIATARSCMSAADATESDLEGLKKDPPFPEKSACVVKCLLEEIKVVNNNHFSKNAFMVVVTPLVFRNRTKMEHYKTVADKCDAEINHHEVMPCQLGNEVTSCIFKYAPELHFKS